MFSWRQSGSLVHGVYILVQWIIISWVSMLLVISRPRQLLLSVEISYHITSLHTGVICHSPYKLTWFVGSFSNCQHLYNRFWILFTFSPLYLIWRACVLMFCLHMWLMSMLSATPWVENRLQHWLQSPQYLQH